MNILEKEVEDLLFYCLTELSFDDAYERGIPQDINMIYERQVNLGEYGIADIIGYDIDYEKKYCFVNVFELKKDKIGVDAFLQAVGYVRSLQLLFKEFKFCYNIILVGKELDMNSTMCFLSTLFENVQFYTYSIEVINGFRLDYKSEFSLINSPTFNKIEIGKTHFFNKEEVQDAEQDS